MAAPFTVRRTTLGRTLVAELLEKMQALQEALNGLSERAAEQIVEIQRECIRARAPIHVARSKVLERVPQFWLQVGDPLMPHAVPTPALWLLRSQSNPVPCCSQYYSPTAQAQTCRRRPSWCSGEARSSRSAPAPASKQHLGYALPYGLAERGQNNTPKQGNQRLSTRRAGKPAAQVQVQVLRIRRLAHDDARIGGTADVRAHAPFWALPCPALAQVNQGQARGIRRSSITKSSALRGDTVYCTEDAAVGNDCDHLFGPSPHPLVTRGETRARCGERKVPAKSVSVRPQSAFPPLFGGAGG